MRAACDAAALWRGALIVSGHIGCLDGEPTLAAVCPTHGYAGTLVAAASRLQVEVRTVPTPVGTVVVVVPNGAAVARVLRAAGAPQLVDRVTGPAAPEVHRRAAPNPRAPRRAESVARARADLSRLAELDEPIPAKFAEAASVRLDHPHATMTQLAVIAGLKPHVLAGRLRRLHVLAEYRQAYPRSTRADRGPAEPALVEPSPRPPDRRGDRDGGPAETDP